MMTPAATGRRMAFTEPALIRRGEFTTFAPRSVLATCCSRPSAAAASCAELSSLVFAACRSTYCDSTFA